MQNITIPLLLVMMVGMMIWSRRQQQKQASQRQEQLNSLTKGTSVVTIGGLYGVIDEVDTEAQTMVLDVDGVYLTFELSALKRILPTTADNGSIETVAEEVVPEEV